MATHPGIDSTFFTANRTRLRASIADGVPIVITAHAQLQRSADIAYPFTQDSNFWYLSGIDEPEYVLVIDENEEYLIAPPRSEYRSIFEGDISSAALIKQSGIKTIYDQQTGWDRLAKRLKKIEQVATMSPTDDYSDIYQMFLNPARNRLAMRLREINSALEIIDVRKSLARLRMHKTPAEIGLIEEAVAKTIELFHHLEVLRSSRSEQLLERELRHRVIDQGTQLGYDPVIASGRNALALHYHANTAKYKDSDLVLFDIGVKTHVYSADLTRTVAIKPTKRQSEVYDAVLSVHEYACSLLKPGTAMRAYEEAVEAFMGEKLKELGLITDVSRKAVRHYYPHATSHFLGIDLHDAADYDEPFAPGMVLTVEPGVYIRDEGIGIRLEDDICITKTGCKNLSAALPKHISSLTIDPNA